MTVCDYKEPIHLLTEVKCNSYILSIPNLVLGTSTAICDVVKLLSPMCCERYGRSNVKDIQAKYLPHRMYSEVIISFHIYMPPISLLYSGQVSILIDTSLISVTLKGQLNPENNVA